MPESAPTVNEDDIADVSLTNVPDIPADKPAETAEEKPKEGADDQGKPADKTPDAKDTEAKDKPAEGDKKPEEGDQKPDEQQPEKPKADPVDRKQQAQMAYQQRQRTRQEIAQQLDQNYGPKTADQLIDENEGMTPEQAQIEAMRQEMAYKEQRSQISDLNAGMRAEAVEVQRDFPVFDSSSPEYDDEFTKMVEENYKTAARLQVENGIILNAEVPLYDFYQNMAAIYSRGTSKGTQQGQQQMQDMLARTEEPGGSSSTNRPAPGSLDEMEERLANVVIT